MATQHADADGLRLLVVGASSGIGHAVAVSAGERGAKVAVAARRMELLTKPFTIEALSLKVAEILRQSVAT